MEEDRNGLRVEIPIAYEGAVEPATAALKEQGVGVLATIGDPPRRRRIRVFKPGRRRA